MSRVGSRESEYGTPRREMSIAKFLCHIVRPHINSFGRPNDCRWECVSYRSYVWLDYQRILCYNKFSYSLRASQCCWATALMKLARWWYCIIPGLLQGGRYCRWKGFVDIKLGYTRAKLCIGSKVPCILCFEICPPRGGEKVKSANFKTKHTEPLLLLWLAVKFIFCIDSTLL